MNKFKFCLLFIVIFFVSSGIVLAENSTGNERPVALKASKGGTYALDQSYCDNYENNYEKEKFEMMVIDDQCYIIFLTNDDVAIESTDGKEMVIDGAGNSAEGTYSPNPYNPNPERDLGKYADNYINLKKLVYLINKGELAPKFEKEYNLKYIKAATLISNNKNLLVIQYLSKDTGAVVTTMKLTFSRAENSDNVNITSTVTATSLTEKILGEFPFWILESAPNYSSKDYDYFKTADIKSSVLASFKDITNYKYTKNGNSFNISAVVPDNINEKVLAVYSDFLGTTPFAEYLQDQSSPSNEGETTSDKTTKKNKVKNTKTGAFFDIKLVTAGLVIAFVGGYLVYRHSKIKKI